MFVLIKLLIIKHLVSVCELQCVVCACVCKVDGREEVCIVVFTWSGSSTRGFHGSSFSNPFPSVYCMNSCRDTSPSLSLSTWGKRGKEGGREGGRRGREREREGRREGGGKEKREGRREGRGRGIYSITISLTPHLLHPHTYLGENMFPHASHLLMGFHTLHVITIRLPHL